MNPVSGIAWRIRQSFTAHSPGYSDIFKDHPCINKGATKAKNPPTRYKKTETQNTTVDHFLTFTQLAARSGSEGQAGDEVARTMALISKQPPAHRKSSALFSDNQISCGNTPSRATNVEPKPTATRSAGRAQHTSVLAERKSVRAERALFVMGGTLNC